METEWKLCYRLKIEFSRVQGLNPSITATKRQKNTREIRNDVWRFSVQRVRVKESKKEEEEI
jgi:hypothetical protein